MTEQFNITINAPRKKVWDTLWGDYTYPQWTAPFCEGSKVITDWQEGSKVIFADSEDRGLVSIIERCIPYEYMAFKMLGEYRHGQEDFTSDNAKKIAGGFERYTLTPGGDNTFLVVDLGGASMDQDIMNYFISTWPKALEALKTVAEK